MTAKMSNITGFLINEMSILEKVPLYNVMAVRLKNVVIIEVNMSLQRKY